MQSYELASWRKFIAQRFALKTIGHENNLKDRMELGEKNEKKYM